MKYGVLTENHLFSKTYSGGKRASARRVVLFILEDRHARLLKKRHPEKKMINRVGISATKKLGSAVKRNRAKRICREAWRQINEEYEIKKGLLVVISCREAIDGAKMQEVKRDLLYATGKLGIILGREKLPC